MFDGRHSASLTTTRPSLLSVGRTSRSFGSHYYQLSAVTGDATTSTLDESTPPNTVARYTIFGPVPSTSEVQKAILELQRFMNVLQSRNMQAPGYIRLSDAFSMMQNVPAFQNMVVSISCDESVWQAVQSNDAVQDLGRTIAPASENKQLSSSSEEPDITMLLLRWISEFAKLKILELVQNFGMLVNEMLHPVPKEKPTSKGNDSLEEKIRSSLLLSVVILLIVVLARSRNS